MEVPPQSATQNEAATQLADAVALRVAEVSELHDMAEDPLAIANQVEEIRKNSTVPPPANVAEVAQDTLRGLAENASNSFEIDLAKLIRSKRGFSV